MSKFLKLIKNEEGATAIEYGLIAALIAVAAIGAMQGIGNKLNTTFNNVSNHLVELSLAPKREKQGGGAERRRRFCFVRRRPARADGRKLTGSGRILPAIMATVIPFEERAVAQLRRAARRGRGSQPGPDRLRARPFGRGRLDPRGGAGRRSKPTASKLCFTSSPRNGR